MQPIPGQAEGHSSAKSNGVYHLSLLLIGMGNMLATVSIFIPTWRYDQGTIIHGNCLTSWMPKWLLEKADSRQYGLLQVKAQSTASWSTVTDAACVNLNLALISFRDDRCKAEMKVQCEKYNAIKNVSLALLVISMISCIFCTISLFVTLASKARKVGGCILGMLSFAVVLPLVFNLVWFITTQSAFSKLDEYGIPMAQPHVGYFLHIAGVVLLLVGTVIYGVTVIPQVLDYDPAQEKLDQRNKKMQQAKMLACGQQGPVPVSMNFPSPPGFAPSAPPAMYSGGWGPQSNGVAPFQPQSAYTSQVYCYGGAGAPSQLASECYAPPTSYGVQSPPVNQDGVYASQHNPEMRKTPPKIMPDLPPSDQGRW